MPDEQQTTMPGVEDAGAAPAADADSGIRFIDWLSQHRSGVLDVDLREAFQEVVQAVQATGKAGSVVLTLKVEPQKGGMFAVTDKIDAKPPVATEAKLYYVDFDGNLTRDNPLQPKLLIPPSRTETETTQP